MAQPSASPTPNVLKPPIASSPPIHSANPLFYPRKEFLRDHPRIVSSFSLLTLASQGFVRLYNFPDSVINGLRRLFEQHGLITGVRENPSNHFFEYALDNKPWANFKSLPSEKLVVSILSVIYQFGYSYLSTIDYAREQDDRIALAFSRPSTAPVNSSIPAVPNGSASTLPQAGPLLFAISFPSTALLRVIEPPLPLTPAILQAVRTAWPRGIAYEKKIGDSYEFKLKGYKWFQENTFSVDSLQQILSLLTALDRHSFTMLASLTLGNRSRTRDLWIFIGPPSDLHGPESPPASPAGSSLELKREITPQHGGAPPEGQHIRSTSPHMSSPLKQVTPSHSTSSNTKLRKPFPKAQIPLAFQSESSLNELGKLPSDVGSVDMTGVGTAHRLGSAAQTPDVFYTTGPVKPGNVYQQEFNPWNRSAAPPPSSFSPPTAQFIAASMGRQHSRHYSMSSTDDPLLRASIQDSPYDIARQSSSSNNSRTRRASSPLVPPPHNLFPQPTRGSPSPDSLPPFENGPARRQSSDISRPDLNRTGTDAPRIPTPPLLSPGVFRDSAFSSSTGWRSAEIPIAWTGKDPEPFSSADGPPPSLQSSSSRVVHGPRERRASGGPRTELQATPPGQPLERRGSTGPALPGAWASTPREEKRQDDVVDTTPPLTTSSSSTPNSSNMIPPTIKEQPSQESEQFERKNVKVQQPEQHRAEGDGLRKSEAGLVGDMDHRQPMPQIGATSKTSSNTTAIPTATTNGHTHPPYAKRPPNAPRSNSLSEGWVLVNIEGKGKGVPVALRSGGAQSPPRAPPLKHQRSQSDSRIPTAQTLAQTTAGAGKSTMSPAAKAIVMVDAIGAKEREKEKAQSGGKLRRLLGRSVDKSTGGHTPEASTSSTTQQQQTSSKAKPVQSQAQGNSHPQGQGRARQVPSQTPSKVRK